jgi:Sec-independent protein secretion pathway component TatC
MRKEIMALTALIILYVICALLTGFLGRDRRMGYVGTVILSLVITPPLMLLILLMFGPKSTVEWRRKRE